MIETSTQPKQLTSSEIAKLRALARPRIDLKRGLKIIRPIEIAFLSILLVAILGIVLVYSYAILPEQVQRVNLAITKSNNEEKLQQLLQIERDPSPILNQFRDVKDSLEAFEGKYLKPRLSGRIALIETVYQLTKETDVKLASGISFTSTKNEEEQTDKKSKQPVRKADPKSQKAAATTYPSLRVGFTISGTYPKVRAFINKLERSSQFVGINSVNLTAEVLPGGGQGGGRGRKSVAPPVQTGTITLDLSMTAYFQPEGQTDKPSEPTHIAQKGQ